MKTESTTVSLSEVHRTVLIPKHASIIKRMLAFAGPAYLVSVGYMDPGNWATDLEGGARFGYQLIWVLLMSNLMAILLQTLSARLGIVTGRDLAQACREHYPKPIAFTLWILCEVAIAACDLAEVLGTAIGLNLLFNVPLLYGVIITGFDTMLFLVIQQLGIRKMEAFILMLISTIGTCFAIEVFLSQPVWTDVTKGFVPHLTSDSLYVAIGILGATVMPHNLYLHSALVQTRAVEQSEAGKQQASKWNLIDTSIALNAAFFVNAAILIVSAAVFFKNGVVVTEIQQAHQLLTPFLGTTIASTLFAVALLSAGQSSTLTGTLAGQIVMEGFLQFKIRPVLRRLITRSIAIIPAILVIGLRGEGGSYGLLILSQVILSLQLPFAVIPLIQFTSEKGRMGKFANKVWVQLLAWISAAVIVGLNARLVIGTLSEWIEAAGSNALWLWLTVIPIAVGCAIFLLYIAIPKSWLKRRKVIRKEAAPFKFQMQHFARVGVALDYGVMDEKVLSHAQTLATQHRASIYLFHIVEGVSGQLYGKEAYDDEARSDNDHLESIAQHLRSQGLVVHPMLGFGRVPDQIVKLAGETKVDILVMGGHRHRGLKDIIFGASISEVRHKLSIPVLVVQ
ncbi:MAG: Nramp family divalent metal transporter [Ignavibacteriae bacterium]|nr:Nramp family divalent metal transporter [Ignavibacteria bacterium]MBI3365053.1 Nramp family divalent metal transporter [Ignavibacteriota bacterium]